MPPAPEGYGTPTPGGMPVLANWGQRAQAGLIDFFILYFAAVILGWIGSQLSNIVLPLAVLWGLFNGYQQGATGQSVGKKMVGIRTLREQDGQLIGAGSGVARAFLHVLDLVPCGLGFLWPIWDDKRQTFSDKIVKSVVIKD